MRIVISLVVAVVLTFVGAASADVLSYTYSYAGTDPGNQPAAEYPDFTGTELNDNTVGPAFYFGSTPSDPWVGFLDQGVGGGFGSQPEMLVAFTDPAGHALDSITVSYLVDNGAYIRAPDSLTLTFSMDGVNYNNGPAQTFTVFPTTDDTVHTLTFNLGGQKAKYVSAEFLNDGGDTFWTFLTEVDFQGGPIPEPASLGFVAVGAAALLTRRRS